MSKISILMAAIGIFAMSLNPMKAANFENAKTYVDKEIIDETKSELQKNGAISNAIIGVEQVALFWQKQDGSAEDFKKFCLENAVKSSAELDASFKRLSEYLEVLRGHYNKMSLDLKRNLHEATGEIFPIDVLFGGYEPSSHFADDLFDNKIAFYILLNFPFHDLETKNAKCNTMSRKEWAFARMGEVFTSRVPAAINAEIGSLWTAADTYIAEYNIYMGHLVDAKFNTFFPKEMKLLSHWNLRDELKSQYSNKDGLSKQKMIYQVMQRIIAQDIPQRVINNNDVQWDPYTNKVYQNQKEITAAPEPNTRYEWVLKLFNALRAADEYSPFYNTYIKRKFDEEMEIPQAEVERIFIEYVTSPIIKETGKLIEKRLGRKLEAFDIWYNGFRAKSGISEEKLNEITRKKYPTPQAFKDDIPVILEKLGFSKEKAKEVAAKIDVDAARGSGHAWGADMKSENAHLRTRIAPEGMDYKGYNIAIHELGHNVEQTLTLQDIDYWMLRSVPNTAFTEAWAFSFQKNDLMLLGLEETNPEKEAMEALNSLWNTYEIMGVSLVDMNLWKWLYANPKATKEQLRDQAIVIAKDIWNKYYYPVFGSKDQTILAVYSHMIDNPLYLSAYPIGHLIEFQMSQAMKGKNLGTEMQRILSNGRITPECWMQKAINGKISGEPTLKAAEEALKVIKK